ncbi:lipocalin-like domain-containing protein [Bradyrhizobium erythrophlei]|jgi:predicted secreted hydrolase|uniref:Predicted secreted hydrolase n=1 Tax=Bradyrhizobium erythrophlei TaxID=1437360 RepID=A0A1M5GR21_9BRAD|nr:lipocalin-like domain-containing protein [Bradyrhizobium erythrophlei]SHG06195.1 Predicted secreted hydrolase [Bradyrhizobium erythrophlei]
MSGKFLISRRGFTSGAVALGLGCKGALAQGFAGLGKTADGFAAVLPGKIFTFPADHGPHPDYRIEWWYVTANLVDSTGGALGAQWTLFRQAMRPGAQQEGWANQQIWMGHAAVTRADTHRFSETFARGGVGQAGVEAKPFRAWIDSWQMRGLDTTRDDTIAPLELNASGADFAYALRLDAGRPLVLQGDAGYSRKSERGQASYYYSQPYFKVTGSLTIDDKPVEVTGQAWMDREWSSQPLASDQSGWDWFSLHLNAGEKLMLFRLRQSDGNDYCSGNWILSDGKTEQIASAEISMTPGSLTGIEGRKLPTTWRIAIPRLGLTIDCVPLNARSWMGTSFPYWEGPISFAGSHHGVGYLEMTGY